jgi:hypothetical protein
LLQVVKGEKMIIVDNVPDGEYKVEIQLMKSTQFILEMLQGSKFILVGKDNKDFTAKVVVNAQSRSFPFFSIKGNNEFTFKMTK